MQLVLEEISLSATKRNLNMGSKLFRRSFVFRSFVNTKYVVSYFNAVEVQAPLLGLRELVLLNLAVIGIC